MGGGTACKEQPAPGRMPLHSPPAASATAKTQDTLPTFKTMLSLELTYTNTAFTNLFLNLHPTQRRRQLAQQKLVTGDGSFYQLSPPAFSTASSPQKQQGCPARPCLEFKHPNSNPVQPAARLPPPGRAGLRRRHAGRGRPVKSARRPPCPTCALLQPRPPLPSAPRPPGTFVLLGAGDFLLDLGDLLQDAHGAARRGSSRRPPEVPPVRPCA